VNVKQRKIINEKNHQITKNKREKEEIKKKITK
jgi:hypothetical protein